MTTTLMPTYARADLVFERGEGAWLYTGDGEAYLDFAAGIAVNAVGHCHPHLVAALSEQAGKLWHTSNLYRIAEGERLAGRLTAACFADTVFFANSGAEAVECAIKTARKYQAVNGHGERTRLITFEGAFHGRTLATLAAGGQKKYLDGFGPVCAGFDQVPFDDYPAAEAAYGEHTAGILLEPIQGEGGVRSFSPHTLKALRRLCDERGGVLVFDEVQCGMGRTGTLFAHQASGVEPDVMALAKGLGGGFPLGACLATRALGEAMTAGTHGSTFGGNPLAMAVGNAVMDIVADADFLADVRTASKRLRQKLARLCDDHPGVVSGVRGEGLMLGLECVLPNTDVAAAARDEHLLTVPAGDNVVRLLPPLSIGEAEVEDAVARLDEACRKLSQ